MGEAGEGMGSGAGLEHAYPQFLKTCRLAEGRGRDRVGHRSRTDALGGLLALPGRVCRCDVLHVVQVLVQADRFWINWQRKEHGARMSSIAFFQMEAR